MSDTLGLAKGIIGELYPPPPPEHFTSPIAFGEIVHHRPPGADPVWARARHIEVMEDAILRTINKRNGRLAIAVSVRHGKSMFGSRIVPAWYLGTHPEKRVMLAGHEADFAARHGRAARDMLTHHGPSLFKVGVSQTSQAANRWDIDAHEGGMLTLGVGGSPIGRGGDVVIVDDPYRNYADAMNPRVRKEVAEWWSGTMVSRIEPGGSVIIIMARWHTDDLIGVLSREQPDMWEVLSMPALCTDPDNDPLDRAMGEPLWPERYDVPDIEVAAAGMVAEHGEAVYEAQFQQNPLAADGDFFDEEAWTYYSEPPDCERYVRAWDLAASENAGDWTVGLLLGKVRESKRFAVLDVERKRVGPDGVRKLVLDTAVRDKLRYGPGVIVNIPQDPAQAGKDQATQYVSMLSGFHVRITPTASNKSKTIKAGGAASQQRVGNVMLPKDAAAVMADGKKGLPVGWVGAFVAETTQFDNGTFDDQVDAFSDAYNRLAVPGARLLV